MFKIFCRINLKLDSYETSYGEGYWTGALYIVRSLIGLALSSSPSSTAPLINIILDLVTIVISLVMIILASLNIVYTPYDISYLYHGVSMLTLCVVTVLTYQGADHPPHPLLHAPSLRGAGRHSVSLPLRHVLYLLHF